MIWSLIFNLLKNKWFWIISLMLVVSYFAYNLYTENQQLKFESAKSKQNELAYLDSLNKAKDSIQVIASYVADLNQKVLNTSTENKKVNNEIHALKAKYEIAIDSINILNKKTKGYIIGDSVIVPFEGKQIIATYTGNTLMNIKTKESTYSLKILFDDIDTRSELFLDESDNMWKMRTISMTPGIKLRGISILDENVFRKISGIGVNKSDKEKIFGIGGIFGKNIFAPGMQLKFGDWSFGANYIVLDNFKVLEGVQDRLIISIYFWPF